MPNVKLLLLLVVDVAAVIVLPKLNIGVVFVVNVCSLVVAVANGVFTPAKIKFVLLLLIDGVVEGVLYSLLLANGFISDLNSLLSI